MTAHSVVLGIPARCRSCKAPIVWAATAIGKATPLDAEPAPDGEWHLDDGKAIKASPTGDLFPQARYRTHFATCPDAAQHRKPRKP